MTTNKEGKFYRNPSEKRELIAELRKLIGKNFTDEEILEKLELAPNILADYKSQIMTIDRATFGNLDPASVFSDYVMKIRQVVRELDEAVDVCRSKSQCQALITAIWRKKEAYDSVLNWGQELGFVMKRSSEIKLSSEMSFTTMSEAEVKKEIEREMANLRDMAKSQVAMRPEVFGLMPEEAKISMPGNVVAFPAGSKKNQTVRTKVKFIVRSQG